MKDYDSMGIQVLDPSVKATLMRSVYYWMTAALVITGMTAWLVGHNAALASLVLGNQAGWIICLVAELGLVMALSAAIDRMSFMTATICFILYSIVNGVTLSVVFLAYQLGTVAFAFFVSAGMFAALALFGTVTRKDLSGIGRFCYMALVGLILVAVVSFFVPSLVGSPLVSVIGVLVFAGLTAWDAQKIQNMLGMCDDVNESTQKIALLGALSLYLDFVNLFLYLLRLFGNRK